MSEFGYRKYAEMIVIFIRDNINAIINIKYIFVHMSVEYLSNQEEKGGHIRLDKEDKEDKLQE